VDGTDEESAENSVAALNDLMQRIGVRITLTDLGLTREDIESLIQPSVDCPDVYTHPVVATREDIVTLFEDSF